MLYRKESWKLNVFYPRSVFVFIYSQRSSIFSACVEEGGGGADLGGTKGETHEGAHDSAQGTDERSMMEEPMESAREMDRRRPWEGNRNARITL